MLDLHESWGPNLTMSRKRTRSRSEDGVTGVSTTTHIQSLTNGNCTAAPFDDDPISLKNRSDCNYDIKITMEMAKAGTASRPVRVYADGAFDLFHQGHARNLLQAKQAFPNVYLIVGVSNDKMVHQFKGRTVMTEEERYNAVRHCRYVDEVLRDAPWEYSDAFLEANKIDFVAHDDEPYQFDNVDDTYGKLKERGMFIATQRTEGVSTSDIVARIVRDYDVYVRRNLARGYSPKDLNVSYLKAKRYKFEHKMGELKDKVKRNIDAKRWKDESKEVVDSFLEYFFKRPMRILQEGKEKFLKALTPPGTPYSSTDDEWEPPRKAIRLE